MPCMCQPFTSRDQTLIVLTTNKGLSLINYIFTPHQKKTPTNQTKKKPPNNMAQNSFCSGKRPRTVIAGLLHIGLKTD